MVATWDLNFCLTSQFLVPGFSAISACGKHDDRTLHRPEALRSIFVPPLPPGTSGHAYSRGTAILAPGRAPLTYRGLYQHVEKAGRALRATGIGRGDRVAVVLPNGPEMAVAILTVAANATCAPVNPAYGAEELGRYFADLRPRTLITKCGIDSPARHVALSRGIRVVELSIASDAEAGLFTLTGDQGAAVRRAGESQRCSSAAAHIRHNIAAKDCPADARQICAAAYAA